MRSPSPGLRLRPLGGRGRPSRVAKRTVKGPRGSPPSARCAPPSLRSSWCWLPSGRLAGVARPLTQQLPRHRLPLTCDRQAATLAVEHMEEHDDDHIFANYNAFKICAHNGHISTQLSNVIDGTFDKNPLEELQGSCVAEPYRS